MNEVCHPRFRGVLFLSKIKISISAERRRVSTFFFHLSSVHVRQMLNVSCHRLSLSPVLHGLSRFLTRTRVDKLRFGFWEIRAYRLCNISKWSVARHRLTYPHRIPGKVLYTVHLHARPSQLHVCLCRKLCRICRCTHTINNGYQHRGSAWVGFSPVT